MEQGDGCPDWPSAQSIVFEGQPEEFSIESKRELALVHVQEHTEYAFFLEWLAVLAPFCVAAMAQLAESVKSKAEVIIAEGIGYTELLLSRDSNF